MVRRLRVWVILFVVGVWISALSQAQTVRLGNEFRINSYTLRNQAHPRIARDGSGNFMVVWSSDRQDGSRTGVFGRRFDVTGTNSTQFAVNTYTSNYQDYPVVASDSSGTFVVAWQSYGQDGSYYGVFGQRFNASAAPAGAEFRISNATSYDQSHPAVVKTGGGAFVVVWNDDDASGFGVFGRRYDSSGTPVGSVFRANTYTVQSQSYPAIGRDGSGNFVVVWESYLQDGSYLGIFGQRYSSTASKLGSEFRVNTYTAGSQSSAQVAENSSGNFIVVWQSPQDGSGLGIFAQRYNASGTKVGGEFQVNTYTTGDQLFPAIGIDSTGNYVIAWQSYGQDGALEGIFAQRYGSGGAPRGVEFRVNSYTTGSQQTPAVSMDNLGNFVVVWQSVGQDGSLGGIFGQRFSTADCVAPTVTAPVDQAACEGGSAIFSVTASGNGPFTYQWRKGSVELTDGPFISGAKTRTLTISNIAALDAGNYNCVVTDYCMPAATVTSASATLTYNALQSVGRVATLSAQKINGGTAIKFNWSVATNADDYVIVEDTQSDGPFATVTGSASDGTTGLTIPIPAGDKFYLAAGRNAACGIGPKK